MSGREQDFVNEAFASNWIAPLGPQVDAFEAEFAEYVGVPGALALSSGTAALHLALQVLGVGPGDVVVTSTFTFAGSANPICYLGATPHFVDSERVSWNMDPQLLAECLASYAAKSVLPKAIVVVHLYGQTADMDAILGIANAYGIPVVEDAAEALGATCSGFAAGARGVLSIFSFNGNKVITTSGGGMLVGHDLELLAHARKLSTQAREPVVHYEHREIGYNYRLSNILAAIGRGQMRVLEQRIAARRAVFEFYSREFKDIPGIELMPEAPWGASTRWLSCIVIDPAEFGCDREALRVALEAANIESRPLWKPMHIQPVFSEQPMIGGVVSESLFERGLCLPSGSALREAQLVRICDVVRRQSGAIEVQQQLVSSL